MLERGGTAADKTNFAATCALFKTAAARRNKTYLLTESVSATSQGGQGAAAAAGGRGRGRRPGGLISGRGVLLICAWAGGCNGGNHRLAAC